MNIFKTNQTKIKIKSNTSSIYKNRGGGAAKAAPRPPIWVCEGCILSLFWSYFDLFSIFSSILILVWFIFDYFQSWHMCFDYLFDYLFDLLLVFLKNGRPTGTPDISLQIYLSIFRHFSRGWPKLTGNFTPAAS